MKARAHERLAAIVVLFVFASVIAAQQTERLVDFKPVVFAPSAPIPALRVVDIRVNETHIITGNPFTAEDDWLNRLTFKVRNVSDKTIILFWFNVCFPEVGGGQAVTAIRYEARKSSDQSKRIPPGGEVDVSLAPNKLAEIQKIRMDQMGATHLTLLNILPGAVFFEDGSSQVISLRRP